MILLLTMVKQEVSAHDKYSDYKLPPNAGLIFENQGLIKISLAKWTLITYLDLKLYKDLENITQEIVINTDTVCEKIVLGHFKKQCYLYKYGIDEQYHKIKGNRDKLLKSIGYKNKYRRYAPLEIIGNIAHLIFGVCDATCINRNNNEILKLKAANDNQLKIVEEQLKVWRLETEKFEMNFTSLIQYLQESTINNNITTTTMQDFFMTANNVLTLYLY